MTDEPKGNQEKPAQSEAKQPPKVGEGSGQDALSSGAQQPPTEKVTAESQGIAPGKASDAIEGKDLAAVKPEQPEKITEKHGLAPDTPQAGAQPPGAGMPATGTPPTGAPRTDVPTAAPKPPAAAPPATEKPAAPVKPAGPTPQPWASEMVTRFQRQFGSGIQPLTYLGQNYMIVDRSVVSEVLQLMRDEERFDYCVDVTAVHYPQREKQFDVLWVLYSFPRNERVRIKTMIADGESVPSAVPIWPTANWLERECYDMFGIRFDGHPDLRRILLPDGWKGFPLRKDYGIIQQDQEWVQINLGIESGQ
ncbi:MAG TPA: NADH-quinone oxidoreductase subunit C [Terriglobales bacterium]|nr:NADH-quinone oxidoreductase subunit C [Terriglobales bacterium]